MDDKLTSAQTMTLERLLDWRTPFPPYTRYAVLRELAERGMVELRVTAKGVMAASEASGRQYSAKTPYAAQIRAPRHRGDTSERGWITLVKAESEYAAADALWETLHQKGFRLSELTEHCADLAKGHVLAAEDGTEYRVAVSTVEED